MTIVVVCTLTTLNDALSNLEQTLRNSEPEHRMIAPALLEFFQNSSFSDPLFTQPTTNIYSFTLDFFIKQFDLWVKSEIKRQPHQENLIRTVQRMITDLFKSEWILENNLVVRECLGPEDAQPQLPGLGRPVNLP